MVDTVYTPAYTTSMDIAQTLTATAIWLTLVYIVYSHCSFDKIKACFGMWFTRAYWTDYNIIEALSWATKAVIIVPGLIFGYSVWWLYLFTLATSLTLIWASNRKLLPTLVAFNTLWAWISCMVLAQHLI